MRQFSLAIIGIVVLSAWLAMVADLIVQDWTRHRSLQMRIELAERTG